MLENVSMTGFESRTTTVRRSHIVQYTIYNILINIIHGLSLYFINNVVIVFETYIHFRKSTFLTSARQLNLAAQLSIHLHRGRHVHLQSLSHTNSDTHTIDI